MMGRGKKVKGGRAREKYRMDCMIDFMNLCYGFTPAMGINSSKKLAVTNVDFG
jgi:hypothetical protein